MKDTNWHRSPMAPSRVRMEARRVGGCAWSMARDEAERNKTACGSEEQEPCPFPVSPGESRAGRVPPTPPNPGGSPRKRASPLARSPANDHRFFHCHKFLLDRNRPSHGSLERKRWAWLIFSLHRRKRLLGILHAPASSGNVTQTPKMRLGNRLCATARKPLGVVASPLKQAIGLRNAQLAPVSSYTSCAISHAR